MIQLRDYQKRLAEQGTEIVLEHGIVFLAMEMRVGKTLISLEIASQVVAERVLFVTKKMAIESIKRDYKEGGYNFPWDVINYESLHKLNKSYDVVICDESHSIGAFPRPTKACKKLKEICKNVPHVILLSGTPTPESYSQIFHQLWISPRSPFKQYQKFYRWVEAGFVIPRQMRVSGFTITDYSYANKTMIDQFIQPLFLTFTQKEANFTVDLLVDKVIHVPTSNNLKKLVALVVKHGYAKFRDGSELICDTAVKLQSKVHQICSGTVITEFGNETRQKVLEDFKARYIVNNYVGKKFAVYYLFDCEGKVIRQTLEDAGFNCTSSPETFNSSDTACVFVSQFQSGSRGINLSSADVLIFYNIHFSSELYQQARQRGQEKNKAKATELHWLFSEGGIEDKVYQRVINKQSYTASYFMADFGARKLGH